MFYVKKRQYPRLFSIYVDNLFGPFSTYCLNDLSTLLNLSNALVSLSMELMTAPTQSILLRIKWVNTLKCLDLCIKVCSVVSLYLVMAYHFSVIFHIWNSLFFCGAIAVGCQKSNHRSTKIFTFYTRAHEQPSTACMCTRHISKLDGPELQEHSQWCMEILLYISYHLISLSLLGTFQMFYILNKPMTLIPPPILSGRFSGSLREWKPSRKPSVSFLSQDLKLCIFIFPPVTMEVCPS